MPLPNTKPLNNNVLIELIDEFAGVSRTNEDGSELVMNSGRLIDFHIEPYHLTASSAIAFDQAYIAAKQEEFRMAVTQGQIVRWEEYAEGGQTFEEDGKKYALIPFWRLISISKGDQ